MKDYILKVVNLALVVGLLFGYNQYAQAQTETYEAQAAEIEAANEEIEAQNAEIEAQNEAAQAASGDISEEVATVDLATENFEDGTYTGTGVGFGGDIVVNVTIEGGEITAIDIASAEKEDEAYFDMAIDIVDDIIEAQSVEVDTISGATFSSTGIKDAVADALSQAVSNE